MKKIVRVVTCDETRKIYIDAFSKPIDISDIISLLDNGYSHNSNLAMRKDWNLFTEFCLGKGVRPLPASVTALRLFLESESKRRKYATLKRYVVTIGLVHRTLSLSDPCSSTTITTLMAQFRQNKQSDARSAESFTAKHLKDITKLLEHSKRLSDIRDLAIYHLMFECMLKRSELKQLNVGDICRLNGEISLKMGQSKYRLSYHTAQYLSRWIDATARHTGPLFTSIDRHGLLGQAPLDDSSIYRILRKASTKLGLKVKFSGQSLRIGGLSKLVNQGVKVKEIQKRGRWQSVAMPYYYLSNKAYIEEDLVVFKKIKPID
ncbi:integrase [Vibrio aquaticus]|uniref:Integrase n=1 Tax=Vibrio aquaticus TaxID=2496559 RepID=A0A432D0C1_9VIBR|nr:tyrosine-type recombinase/integrase [Vibrio aquaticus]RTZ17335.1 integrase [Vibrio aquaticus]